MNMAGDGQPFRLSRTASHSAGRSIATVETRREATPKDARDARIARPSGARTSRHANERSATPFAKYASNSNSRIALLTSDSHLSDAWDTTTVYRMPLRRIRIAIDV